MNPFNYFEKFSSTIEQRPLIALAIAAVGGLLSLSTCPCRLPAGVGVVSFVGSQVESAPEGHRRRRGVLLSVSFFVGVVLSLVGLGIGASVAGRLFSRWKAAFAIGAALFSLAAGLAAIFGPTVRRYVPDPEINKRGGIAGPLFLLLTIAAAIGRPMYGAALSFAYAIGRGLPFLLLGLFAGTVGAWLA